MRERGLRAQLGKYAQPFHDLSHGSKPPKTGSLEPTPKPAQLPVMLCGRVQDYPRQGQLSGVDLEKSI